MKYFLLITAICTVSLNTLGCNGAQQAASKEAEAKSEELATDPDYEKEMMGEMGN